MPVKIPDDLPARAILERENIFVMTAERAQTQDIRPLKLILLNLMPLKIQTETSLLRCLSNTPLQIEVDLLQTQSYQSTHTAEDHLESFYKTLPQVEDQRYDGMIITGAPVERMPFEQVAYWPELTRIMDWAEKHVFSTLYICWGAQAGLHYHYGLQKRELEKKVFGVFEHHILKENVPLFRGFDENFRAPHSRHTEIPAKDIAAHPQLTLLALSDEAGFYVASSRDGRRIFVQGHPEYEVDALAREYRRDRDKGMEIDVPSHYYPDDDPQGTPPMTWRSHAQLLYTNWLNYYVYQTTPYDLSRLG
jgi:homoserine O-succinyltransferase